MMKRFGFAVAGHVFALALCTVILAWVLDLRHLSLNVPFDYQGDGLLYHTWVKGMMENGWYLHNPALGAPDGCDMHDFPMPDTLHFLCLKLLSFSCGYFTACNLYFLLTFPLTTFTTLLVLRHLRVSYPTGLVVSLLFTFLPYHMLRATGHLFLGAYYLVPLAVMIVFWVFDDAPLLKQESPGRAAWRRLTPRAWASGLICLLLASAGIYYAAFACFFFLLRRPG